jgi:TPR repeat protein
MRLATLAALLVACQSSGAPPSRGGPAGAGEPAPPCAAADCEARCTAGEADACARAGELLFDGKSGHPLDMAGSFRHASRACDAGVMLGCFLVGYHHQDGLGAAWDPARAVAAYERACAGGFGTACYNLGSMYSGGQGIDPDPTRAKGYMDRAQTAWKAACDGSEPRWCTNAAYLVVGESPSPADLRAGLVLHERACRGGVLIGCIGVARMKRDLGELDGPAMVAELERICGRGEPESCTEAGRAVSLGLGVAVDRKRGLALFQRACDKGDEEACYLLGLSLASGEAGAADLPGARQALTRACDRAHGQACAALAGEALRRGDLAAGVSLETRACRMGQPDSCLVVAVATFAGRGVPASETNGVAWARQACRGGVPDGCRLLLDRGVPLPLPADLEARIRARLCEGGMAAACAAPAPTGGAGRAPDPPARPRGAGG